MKLLFNIFLAILIFFTFLPFNWFFENNFNSLPFQLTFIFLLTRLFFYLNLKHIYMFIISCFVLLMSGNIDFNQIFTSLITATFFTISFILFTKELKYKIKNFNNLSIILFLIIILFTTYYNIDFLINY